MGIIFKAVAGYLATELATKAGRQRLRDNAQEAKDAAVFVATNAGPLAEIAKEKAVAAGATVVNAAQEAKAIAGAVIENKEVVTAILKIKAAEKVAEVSAVAGAFTEAAKEKAAAVGANIADKAQTAKAVAGLVIANREMVGTLVKEKAAEAGNAVVGKAQDAAFVARVLVGRLFGK